MAEEIVVTVRGVDRASQVLDNLERRVGSFGSKAREAAIALGSFAVGAAGAGAAIGIRFNAFLEQASIGFETMLGSGEKAQAFLEELKVFAARTPFELKGLVAASQRLLAYGFTAQEVVPMLTAVGDASAALGAGQEGINRITRALGQMRARGKVASQEMLQLTEVGIPAWEMLAKAMGLTIPELQDMVTQGLVPADEAVRHLLAGMQQDFGGLMAKQSRTFSGAMSTIRDSVEQALGAVTLPLFEGLSAAAVRVADFLSSDRFQGWAASFGERLASLLPPTEKIGEALGILLNTSDSLSDSFTLRLARALAALGLEGMEGSLNAIGGAFEFFGNVAARAADIIATDLSNAFNVLSGIVGPLLELLSRLIQHFADVGDEGEGSAPAVEVLTRAVELFIGALVVAKVLSFVGGMASLAGAIVAFPIHTVQNAAKAVGDFVSAAASMVDKAVTITQNVVRTGAQFIEKVVDLSHTITQNIVRIGARFIEKVSDITQTITQKVIAPKVPEESARHFGTGFASSMSRGFGAALGPSLGAALGAALPALGRTLAPLLPTLLPAAAVGGAVTSAVLGGLDLAKGDVTGGLAQILGPAIGGGLALAFGPAFVPFGMLAGTLVGQLINAYSGPITEFIKGPFVRFFTDSIPNAAGKIFEGFINAVKSFFTPENIGKRLADLVAIAIIAMFPIPILIIRFREKIAGFFESVGATFASFFTETLPAGLKDVWRGVLTVAFAVADMIAFADEQLGRFFRAVSGFFRELFTVHIPRAVTEGFPVTLQATLSFFRDLPGNIRDVFLEGVPDTVNAMVGAFTGLPGDLMGILDKVSSEISNWLGGLSSWLTEHMKPWDWVQRAWDAFVDRIWEWLRKIWGGSIVEEWLANLSAWLTENMNPWKWVQTAWQALVDNIGGKLAEVLRRLAAFPGEAITALGDLTGLLRGKGSDLIGGLRAGVESQWSNARSFFTGLGGKILAAVGDLSRLLFGVGQNVILGFWNGLKSIWPSVESWFGSIADKIPGPIKRFFGIFSPSRLMMDIGQDIMRGLVEGLQAQSTSVVTLFKELPRHILDVLQQGAPAASHAMVDAFAELPNRIMGVLDKVSGQISSWVRDLASSLREQMQPSNWIQSARDAFVERMDVEGKLSEVLKRFAAFPGEAITAIGDLAGLLRGKGADLVDGLKAGILSQWDSVLGFFGALGRKTLAAVGDLAGSLTGKGSDLVAGLKAGILSQWGSVLSFFAALGRNVRAAVGDLSNLLLDMGQNVILGFWNGLKSIWPHVEKWFGSIADKIPGPLKRIFGIGSPSKLMMGIGQDIMRGLAVGLEAELANVSRTLSEFVRLLAVPAAATPRVAVPPAPTVSGDIITVNLGPIHLGGTATREDVRQLVQLIEDEWRIRRRLGR